MKNALVIGAAAVGVYLLWRYLAPGAPVTAADAKPASAAANAASSMTASGASSTTYGGATKTPGLLRTQAGQLTKQGTIAGRATAAARDGLVAFAQTALADARPEPTPAAPAWTATPVLGLSPISGALPANDYGGGKAPLVGSTSSSLTRLASLVRK